MTKKRLGWFLLFLVVIASTAVGTYFLLRNRQPIRVKLHSPFAPQPTIKPLPLNQYSLANLKNYDYQASQLELTELVAQADDFNTYLFSYQTMGKNMTGVVNAPNQINSNNPSQKEFPVIIMIRGYATKEQHYPGFGTNHAAQTLAKNGYITIAPDFFSFGASDAEPEDSWEARFIKPINVIELIYTIKQNPIINIATNFTTLATADNSQQPIASPITSNPNQIGLWGHSNGGQITLSVLEILSQPMPATIWAPMTAPFPYSILFFTDTNLDEGKESRAWLAMFEQDYDVFDFSITQHLNQLTGPLQIHHGDEDEAALQVWSDNFVEKIELENENRQSRLEETKNQPEATAATQLETDVAQSVTHNLINSSQPTTLIEYFYYTYVGADHNLQPAENWNAAISRDLDFFDKYLQNIK
jgi:dienelactone hydrolase